jgi:hypothetical protein
MHLEASVHIRRSPQDVWAYLGDVSNIAVWDRGVSRTEASSSTPPGVGFEFDTFAHSRGNSLDGTWGKMSYRIADIDPERDAPSSSSVPQATHATSNPPNGASAWKPNKTAAASSALPPSH